eukprot:TRINITY_DN5988_c0_g2_i3.p1 TRINITY_DN5988_c0_g2~~TRINITY_DN5988_c0_g2_i3.p1  ORF type:complete len:154 (+),score=2.62 TRINITY_DN5988_c0_g2_i3:3-464(+)
MAHARRFFFLNPIMSLHPLSLFLLCGLFGLCASQPCSSSNEFSVLYDGSPYFSVGRNGSCSCQAFSAGSYYGNGSALTGLGSNPALVAINQQVSLAKTAAGTSFNGTAVAAPLVTTVQAALEALYAGFVFLLGALTMLSRFRVVVAVVVRGRR